MNPLTPQEALKAYRAKSPIELIQDAERFLELSIEERTELLFYMIAHQANQLGVVSDRIGEECQEMSKATEQ